MTATPTHSVSASPGIGLILAIVFSVLKLTGVVAWPWLWVLAPVWIPLALALVFAVILGIIILVTK